MVKKGLLPSPLVEEGMGMREYIPLSDKRSIVSFSTTSR